MERTRKDFLFGSLGLATVGVLAGRRKKALDAGTQNLTVPLWGERIV